MVIIVSVLVLVAVSLGAILLEVGERLGNGKLRFSRRTPVSIICALMVLYLVVSKIFNIVL